MSDEPHFWVERVDYANGHWALFEYVALDGPTEIPLAEVCKRLNNQRESLADYQKQEVGVREPLEYLLSLRLTHEPVNREIKKALRALNMEV